MDLNFLKIIDEKREMLDGIADELWEFAETAYKEFKSAGRLCQALREEGFQVEEGLAASLRRFAANTGPAGR